MLLLLIILAMAVCSCWGSILVPWLAVAGISMALINDSLSLINTISLLILLSMPVLVFICLSSFCSRFFHGLNSDRLIFIGVCGSLWLLSLNNNLENLIAKLDRISTANNHLTNLVIISVGEFFNVILIVTFVITTLLICIELPFEWARNSFKKVTVPPIANFRLIILLFILSLGGKLIFELIETKMFL